MKIKILEFLKNKKGAMGIGTLIVFIAMVLVAAVAASVLINTSGFLQQKASSTGKESTEQVASGLLCSGVSGHIYKYGNTFYDLDKMVMYISPNAGSAPIDLKQAKLFLTYDGKSVVLKYGGKVNADAGSQNIFNLTNAFAINFTNSSYSVSEVTLYNASTDNIVIHTNNNKLKAVLKGLSSGDSVTIDSNNSDITAGTGTVENINYDGDYLTINISGSNLVADTVTSGTKLGTSDWVKLNGTAVWGGANDKQFLIAPLQDNDGSVVNTGVINKGDLVAILVNSQAAFDTEIPERTAVSGKLQPEFGAPAVVDFTTPVAYTKEVMELQ